MWKQDGCMCDWVRWGTVIPHIQGHLLGVTFSCSPHGLPAKDAPKQARRPAYCTPSASAWGLQPPPGLPVQDPNFRWEHFSQPGPGATPPPSTPGLCQRPLPPSGCPCAFLPFAVSPGGPAHRSFPAPSPYPFFPCPPGAPAKAWLLRATASSQPRPCSRADTV